MNPAFRTHLLRWGALAPVLSFAPAPDLDVAVPPGSPLEWAGAFPGYTPARAPLFPLTRAETPDPARTSASAASRGGAAGADVRFAQSFGLVRVLTWDVASHLDWITKSPGGPLTGGAGLRPAAPRYGDALYWVALAPLLRLLLHPDVMSPAETLAHLVEIGDPVHAVLAAAAPEKDLSEACATLRRLIPVAAADPPDSLPLPEGSPRARMFARFVLEECLRDEPFDPAGTFGKRLYLFHREAEPLLVHLARQPSLALKRNAIAALGRYRTPGAAQALAEIAAEGEDPVAEVRALAALGRFRGRVDARPLLERLAGARDPVLRAAWIGALGRMGLRAALPQIQALGEQALLAHDSELMVPVLSALAQIPPSPEHALVRTFAERVRADARDHARDWRPALERASQQPDVPDLMDARAELVAQLALLAAVQAEPLAADLVDALFALPRPAPVDPRLLEAGSRGTDPLGGLLPPARFLYLHALAQVGERGTERLATLVDEPGLEAGLRGRALALLPWDRRAELAPKLFEASATLVELRIHALEILLADVHPAAGKLCRALLAELAAAAPGGGTSAQRYLWTRALRDLSEAGELEARELVPLLQHPRSSPAARRTLRAELRARLSALVGIAGEGTHGKALAERVREVLEFVEAGQLGRTRDADGEDDLEAVLQALEGLKAHRADEGYAQGVLEALFRRLTGDPPPPPRELGVLQPSIPLEEEILLALGRTRASAAAELLVQVVRDEHNDLRAWAALGLGMSGQPAAARELVPRLSDPDPFVRFCAGESLRHLTQKELEVDWMYGSAAQRSAAIAELEAWLRERR